MKLTPKNALLTTMAVLSPLGALELVYTVPGQFRETFLGKPKSEAQITLDKLRSNEPFRLIQGKGTMNLGDMRLYYDETHTLSARKVDFSTFGGHKWNSRAKTMTVVNPLLKQSTDTKSYNWVFKVTISGDSNNKGIDELPTTIYAPASTNWQEFHPTSKVEKVDLYAGSLTYFTKNGTTIDPNSIAKVTDIK